jgi:hypothetical protein
MTRIIENIVDLNTPATKPRELTVTLKLVPDNERQTVIVSAQAKSKLQPLNAVAISLYVDNDGAVYEMTPQIPGQYDMIGGIQEQPIVLRQFRNDSELQKDAM